MSTLTQALLRQKLFTLSSLLSVVLDSPELRWPLESAMMDALEPRLSVNIRCLREMDKASIPAAMHATEAAFLRSGFVRLSAELG